MSTEEFINYLRQLADDHRASGSKATAEDYEEAIRRLKAKAEVIAAQNVMLDAWEKS